MLEIGLSGLPLDFPHSGTAVYARQLARLLPEVAPDLGFRLYLRDAVWSQDQPVAQPLSTPFASLRHRPGMGARLDKLTWETVSWPLAAAIHRESLLHSLYFSAPVLSPAPLVVTIHDLITRVLPGYHRHRQSEIYSRFMAWTCRRAAAVITVSEHSKRDIVRVLGVPEGRVHVTHEAVDERFNPEEVPGETSRLRQRYGLPERFLLYTGGAERRKNIGLLIKAWSRVAPEMRSRGVGLVVVARFPRPDALYPDVPGLIGRLGLEGYVRVIGAVDEEDMPSLYRAALGFCFPSIYEGFGFTPLEAMASGVPVISSNAASLAEVVAEGGLLLSPENENGWAEAMLVIVDSERERTALRERGLRQASRFCWRRTALETVAVYREVLQR